MSRTFKVQLYPGLPMIEVTMTDDHAPAEWVQWTPLKIWDALVRIGVKDRRLSLHQCGEQPEYFLFFRGDGNDHLICGPTLDQAKAFAEKWLERERAASNKRAKP